MSSLNDFPHPDLIQSGIKEATQGNRYEFYSGACYLLHARAAGMQGASGLTVKFFSNPDPDGDEGDTIKCILSVPDDRTDAPDLYFPNGLYIEVEGIEGNSDVALVEADWVARDEYCRSFPRIPETLAECWENAAGRSGSALYDNYDRGTRPDEEWDNEGAAGSGGVSGAPKVSIFTTDPTVNDDSADGYSAGDLWVNSTDDAVFVLADATAGAAVWTEVGAGGGGSTLQAAYDASTSPEILTDATNGALSVKRGSAADTDNVIEVLNNAGTITAAIAGDGTITTSSTVDSRDIATDGTKLDDLVTLTGVAGNSTNLGTFTNSIIADNETIKGALQDVEDALEGSLPVRVDVHNNSGSGMTKGQAVYVSGTHTSGKPEISLADANGASTYPAIGLLEEDIANGAEGFVVISGLIENTNTSSYSAGDSLYLSETPGAVDTTRPGASTTQVQRLGLVSRAHASNGSILVIGAGRANDVPNEITTLTGVALDATDLGTFTGSTIADNETIKGALEDLDNKLSGIASGAEVNPAVPTQAQAEDVSSSTEYSWTPERVKNVADVTPRNESMVYVFTVSSTNFPASANVPVYMAEQNETIDSVYVVPSHASSGSSGSNNWAIDVKKTGGTSLCSTVYNTSTSELAALTPRTLGVDQNNTLGAEDVLYINIVKTGTPTSYQHKTWTFVIKTRKTPAT